MKTAKEKIKDFEDKNSIRFDEDCRNFIEDLMKEYATECQDELKKNMVNNDIEDVIDNVVDRTLYLGSPEIALEIRNSILNTENVQ